MLKMRSRSPKSNHFFPPSQLYIFASFVKIHPLVQTTECRQDAMRTRRRNLIIESAGVTLKMRSRSPKYKQFFPPIPIMCLCMFGQNPPIDSGEQVQTRSYVDADADRIRTKSTDKPPSSVGGSGDIIKNVY